MKKMIIAREPVDDSHLPSHLHPVIKQIYATRNVSHADELNKAVKANSHRLIDQESSQQYIDFDELQKVTQENQTTKIITTF